jgi:hypothetical protein
VYGPFELSCVNGDARSKSMVVEVGPLALADLSVGAGDGGGTAEPRFDDGGTGKAKSSSVKFLPLAMVAALADLLRGDVTEVCGFAFCGALG